MPQRRTNWKYLPWIVVLAFAGCLSPLQFWQDEIELNVAPLARVVVDGNERFANPSSLVFYAFPEVLVDGFDQGQFVFETPPGENGRTLEFELPGRIAVHRIAVIGTADPVSTTRTIRVSGRDPQGVWIELHSGEWQAMDNKPPMLVQILNRSFDRFQIVLHSERSGQLLSFHCFSKVRRWQAWIFVLSLNLLLPWMAAAISILSVLGAGRLVMGDRELVVRLLLGLIFFFATSLAWCAAPRSFLATSLFVLIAAGCTVLEVVRIVRSAANERRLAGWMLAGAGLLLAQVMTDSCFVGNYRVQPSDHVLPYVGAKILALGNWPPAEISPRPWLLQVLYAPWDLLAGRFSYWIFLGWLAGLNSLILIPVFGWSNRWNADSGLEASRVFLLLPILPAFHFIGQRPLVATLILVATYILLNSRNDRHWLSGLALAGAIGVHPGALFVLPGLLIYLLATRSLVKSLYSWLIPIVAYAGWSFAMSLCYPGVRNHLMFYPIMLHDTKRFPEGQSLIQILTSLPAEHWAQLAWNRLGHFSQYFWTGQIFHLENELAVLRRVTLPNLFGWVMLPVFLLPSFWRGKAAFAWLVVVAPLMVHHAYIGSSHAQFHISPTPFFGLGVLLAAWFSPLKPAWKLPLFYLAALDWFLHQVAPFLFLLFGWVTTAPEPFDGFYCFGYDNASYLVLALLPAIIWIWLYWLTRTRRQVSLPLPIQE